MSKEIAPQIPSFNSSPDGPSPFDMIISGAFAFEAPAILEPVKSISVEPASLKLAAKLNSPVTNGLSLEERIAQKRNMPQPERMSRREWLVQEVRNNATSITNLNDAAFYAARRQEMACAGNDGHGIQANNSLSSNGELSGLSNVTSIFSKTGAKHEAGKHSHCEHGEDYGKCSKGCKAA